MTRRDKDGTPINCWIHDGTVYVFEAERSQKFAGCADQVFEISWSEMMLPDGVPLFTSFVGITLDPADGTVLSGDALIGDGLEQVTSYLFFHYS